MPKFKEFEIKNFLGIASSNRNPRKEECQICKNFDLRSITGDLVSRKGYLIKYAKPSYIDNPASPGKPFDLSNVTELRATNFVVDIDGTEKEITLQFMKGTLSAVSGSLASPASINIGLFFVRPYYDGSSWIDEWLWLNECYLTTISSLANNRFAIYGNFPNALNYFAQWTVYNIDNDQYSEIYNSSYSSTTRTDVKVVATTSSVTHNFANGDNVLVMRNFIPYADLQEYYNVNANEVVFYNVLNDLRIAFGGMANRLPLMVGYRDKGYYMVTPGLLGGSEVNGIALIKKIMIQPYNSLTEDTKASVIGLWGDTNAFHLYASTSATNALPTGRWFFKLTGLIDGYEEFVLPIKIYYEAGGGINTLGTLKSYLDTGSPDPDKYLFQFRMFWGLFNKRFKKLRLYASYDSTKAAEIANTPYYLIKEWNLMGNPDASGVYDLNNYGYMYNMSPSVFGGTVWDNIQQTNLNDLSLKINYSPDTVKYVRGFDHAINISGKIFVMNPYVDGERLSNYIFYSPFSGSGASQYDALQSAHYISIDSKDGNDLKGLAALPNNNLAAGKNNNFVHIRTSTAQLMNTSFGYGLDTFRSMVNQGNKLTWCSQEDVFTTSGINEVNLSKNTIRELFRAISDKTLIFATKEERENSYRFFDGISTQYLLSPRGWVEVDTYIDPEDYIVAKDGNIWFMKDGVIYYHTGTKDVDNAGNNKTIALQWKSIPFDISLLGEGIKSTDMFYVDNVWCRYETSSVNLKLKIYIDGVQFGSDILLPSADIFVKQPLPFGGIGRQIELEITDNTQVATSVYSCGFRWRVLTIDNRV